MFQEYKPPLEDSSGRRCNKEVSLVVFGMLPDAKFVMNPSPGTHVEHVSAKDPEITENLYRTFPRNHGRAIIKTGNTLKVWFNTDSLAHQVAAEERYLQDCADRREKVFRNRVITNESWCLGDPPPKKKARFVTFSVTDRGPGRKRKRSRNKRVIATRRTDVSLEPADCGGPFPEPPLRHWMCNWDRVLMEEWCVREG